jgi:hypothetical protein
MEFGKVLFEKDYIDYYCLDLNIKRNEDKITYIQGDITNINLNINMDFNIIFSKDTFEHILNPWDGY